ncbi:MAG: ParA family protein [Actinomycetota bacterium]
MTAIRQRTFAVINQKGGVGKTTITLGLASAADAAGARILVIDLDPQGSTSWVLGIDPHTAASDSIDPTASLADAVLPSSWSPHIDVVPATGRLHALDSGPLPPLAEHLGQLGGDDRANSSANSRADYDAVLIDCPPSLGALTVGALSAARHALIVVEPSALGLRGIGGIADAIDEVWDRHNPDLELSGVILNRVPASSNEAARRQAELARIVGTPTIWQPSIPQRVILNEAIGARRPIHSYGWRAADSIAAFDALWPQVASRAR